MNDVLKFIEMEKNQKDSQNSSETNSTHSQQTTDTAAPDGGWGWLVCLGSFVINFILDGTMFSFGVMLLTLLEYFGESKAKTSWIGSVLLGLSMILGKVRKCKYITGFVAVYVFNLMSFVKSTCNIYETHVTECEIIFSVRKCGTLALTFWEYPYYKDKLCTWWKQTYIIAISRHSWHYANAYFSLSNCNNIIFDPFHISRCNIIGESFCYSF